MRPVAPSSRQGQARPGPTEDAGGHNLRTQLENRRDAKAVVHEPDADQDRRGDGEGRQDGEEGRSRQDIRPQPESDPQRQEAGGNDREPAAARDGDLVDAAAVGLVDGADAAHEPTRQRRQHQREPTSQRTERQAA